MKNAAFGRLIIFMNHEDKAKLYPSAVLFCAITF